MRSKKRNIISISVLILLIFLTFYFLLKDSEIVSISSIIVNCNVKYLLLGVLMVFVYLFVGGYYLKIILKSLGFDASNKRCFFYMCSDFYFSAITPSSTGGQPAEIYYMSKDGIPALTSTMAIILISAIYKIVIIILGLIFLIFNYRFVVGHGFFFCFTYFFGLVTNIVLCIFFFFLMFSPKLVSMIVKWGIGVLGKFKIIKDPNVMYDNFLKMLDDYKRSAEYLKNNLSIIFRVLFLAFIQRMSLFTVPYFIYKSFGFNSVPIIYFILVQTGVTLSIDGLPLPGGIGASEMLFLNLYKDIYKKEMVMPAMLLSRGVNYYFCLIFTAIIVFINHIRIMKSDSKFKEI